MRVEIIVVFLSIFGLAGMNFYCNNLNQKLKLRIANYSLFVRMQCNIALLILFLLCNIKHSMQQIFVMFHRRFNNIFCAQKTCFITVFTVSTPSLDAQMRNRTKTTHLT